MKQRDKSENKKCTILALLNGKKRINYANSCNFVARECSLIPDIGLNLFVDKKDDKTVLNKTIKY